MKYIKILEAVNRGIQLALDDFDDEDQVQNVKSKQIQNKDYTKEYLDLMNEVVDLGLPSGTLWCKYNLGVDSNQLSKPEDWYGNYYQWGETCPEQLYNWYTYEHANGDQHRLTKYCNDPQYWEYDTPVDNLTRLKDNDDAAYQNMHCHNFKFHIPTREQFKELIEYTDQQQTECYRDVPGLNGKILISKINKQQIFFPFCGFISKSKKTYEGSLGYYWTSDLSSEGNDFACYFNVYYSDVNLLEVGNRKNGFTIRPVCKL